MKPILILIEGDDELRPVAAGLGATAVPDAAGAFRTAAGAGTDVVVTVTGVGPERSYAAAVAAIDRFDPGLVISAGTCGALTGAMECSDWLVAGTVSSLGAADGSGRQALATLESPAGATVDRLARALHGRARRHAGRLVTVADVPVTDAAEKAALARAHDAVAVDMESYGIARAAAERNRPWLIARVVVDTPAIPLPELGAMNVVTGRPPLSGIAWYVLRHPMRGPKTLYGLWRLIQVYAGHLVGVLPELMAGTRQ